MVKSWVLRDLELSCWMDICMMKGCQIWMSQWRSVEVRGIRKIFSFRNVILYELLYSQWIKLSNKFSVSMSFGDKWHILELWSSQNQSNKEVNWGIMTIDLLFCKVENCIESCQIGVLKIGNWIVDVLCLHVYLEIFCNLRFRKEIFQSSITRGSDS